MKTITTASILLLMTKRMIFGRLSDEIYPTASDSQDPKGTFAQEKAAL